MTDNNRQYTVLWQTEAGPERDKWFTADTYEKACEYRANVVKGAKESWNLELSGDIVWRTVTVHYGDWNEAH